MAAILHSGSIHSHGHSHGNSKISHQPKINSTDAQTPPSTPTFIRNNLSVPSSNSSREHSRTSSFSKSLKKDNFLNPSDSLNIVHRLSIDGQLIRASIDHNELEEIILSGKLNKLEEMHEPHELKKTTESDLHFDSNHKTEANTRNINIRAALLHVIGGKYSFICCLNGVYDF